MRSDCDWFTRRARTVWRAQPGRSMLVMVPQGCEEVRAVRLVRDWIGANFVPPATHANHKPICIDLVSDGLESSAHFATAVSHKVARQLQIEVEGDPDDFPTDILQNAIEAAVGAGAFPILIIQRFHAFANIRDGGMTSMLSRLRTLECDGLMTTLAFSPVGYAAIRQAMDSEQPFLNSVYGDMHDEAVMTPVTSEDFLAEAQARGVAPGVAHRLFRLGGGPDAVFTALLDLHDGDDRTMVGRCADRAGAAIDGFLRRSIPSQAGRDRLLVDLALGRLSPAQEAFFLNHPLGTFLCKRNGSAELVCSSPIIAQRILGQDASPLARYGRCLDALDAGDHAGAAALAADLADAHPRLAAFRELAMLRGALTAVPERGLLGLDWRAAAQATRHLRTLVGAVPDDLWAWVEAAEACIRVVLPTADNRRLQADGLTRRAADPEVRRLLLFMIDGLVRAVPTHAEPSARVHALVNVPEAILQSLAAGFCGIDFHAPPRDPPQADYDAFFGGQEGFSFPPEGRKLTLGNLLVVVPALLAQGRVPGTSVLVDPARMRPLQQKLVDAVRNPASHTITDFVHKDAALLDELCRLWIADWCRMEGLGSPNELPIRKLAPGGDRLRSLVTNCAAASGS